MKRLVFSFVLLAGGLLGAQAEVDPNFYIYLCFGQSNMEGNLLYILLITLGLKMIHD